MMIAAAAGAAGAGAGNGASEQLVLMPPAAAVCCRASIFGPPDAGLPSAPVPVPALVPMLVLRCQC
jgi:hypothetical protein